MSISEKALERAEQTARQTGFGPRDDYPFLSESAISAADWKGHSIISCVFADRRNADTFVGQCLNELADLGGEKSGQILPMTFGHGGDMFIAVISGIDLMHKSEIEPES